MSRAKDISDPIGQLVEHLHFLRELGVREIRVGPRQPSLPAVTATAPVLAETPVAPARASQPVTASAPAPPSTLRHAAPAPRPSTPSPHAAKRLEILRTEEIGECRRCRLCESRTKIVFGVGSAEARLMFVGEGPGRDEDAQGIPFVGRAGQLLTDIIKAMKLTREQVYIANVVKCRPPENRTPEPDEVEACRGFLEAQIEIIAPRVIVCLGAVAAHTLLGTSLGITKIRGELREFKGIPVMPTYHPAYLLRSPNKKREVWDDMKQVMGLLGT